MGALADFIANTFGNTQPQTQAALAEIVAATPASVWATPGEMCAVTGSPSLAGTGGSAWPSWKMDAASIEIVGTTIDRGRLPGWATFTVDLWWVNDGAGAGDVAWRLDYIIRADGDAYGTGAVTGSTVFATAPVSGTLKVTALASALPAPSATQTMLIKVVRLATDAGDTLANDAAIFGVRLKKAT